MRADQAHRQTFLVLNEWTGWPTSAFLHQDLERDTVQLVEQTLREDGILAFETIDAFVILLRAVRGRTRKTGGARECR